MTSLVIINLLIFCGLIILLTRLRARRFSLAQQILAGLLSGVAFGLALQVTQAGSPAAIEGTLLWTNVVGEAYINLLKMIIMPLVLVMMIAAVVRMRQLATLGKIGGMVIGILVATTMVSALVGIAIVNVFGLTAEGLTEGARELARVEALAVRQETLADLTFADMLLRFIPSNIFYDLTGARPTSVIAVVLFGILFGIAALQVAKDDPERGRSIT
ncbi:MAG TPA: cation:dicarboxylase symporter family transporter, partial [Woeseiaceae bacterium]